MGSNASQLSACSGTRWRSLSSKPASATRASSFSTARRWCACPPWNARDPRGPVQIERTIKLLPVGAISITVRVPFEVAHIRELVEFHDLAFAGGALLLDEVTQLAEKVCAELDTWLIRPLPKLAAEEAYTVFCIASPLVDGTGACLNAENWLQTNRRDVAALLTQETEGDHLSKQESDESTGLHLSYYDHDIIVMDWDAALLMDEPANFDESLYIMELANLQLAELEAYDRILDDSLERAYRDLRLRPIRSRRGVLGDLREIRIDLARLSDELSNITKFLGDWHLARIYQSLASALPSCRLAPHHRREAQDPRRTLPTPQPGPHEPLDAHAGNHHRAPFRDRFGHALLQHEAAFLNLGSKI